jgi:DNA-binding NtrC family response regulator
VLETGEFIRVGSSKVIRSNVRVIAATNVDVGQAIQQGKFREDLFYRLCSVPIEVPPLRHRKEDIPLLFRKFAIDFADRNRMPSISLTEEAIDMLSNYRWPGNIRQLKNIAEQISIIEEKRLITPDVMRSYLPDYFESKLPAVLDAVDQKTFASEREILYKILFDMRSDMNELKKYVHENMHKNNEESEIHPASSHVMPKFVHDVEPILANEKPLRKYDIRSDPDEDIQDTQEITEESLSLAEKEIEMIRKALDKHKGKRKHAASELGISERTLYRKIKEFNIE